MSAEPENSRTQSGRVKVLAALLAFPRFEEREQQRQAGTLYGVSLTIVAASAVWILTTWLNDWGPWRLAVAITTFLTAFACLGLARAGHSRAGSILMLLIGAFAITAHLLLGGPELAPTLGGYYMLVVIAGVLLGGIAAAAAALFGFGVLVCFVYWDGISMLATAGSTQTEWDIARANGVALFALALLLAFAARRTNEAFRKADQAADRLVEANTTLRATQDQVLRAQKLETVGTIAGAVAHDFNNYLTVIDGYAALIADGDDPDSREYALEIQQATERSAQLTRQLLALGRQQVFDPRLCAVDELLNETSGVLRKALGADCELRLRPGAPDCAVRVDPAQFEQALINLALNARDAMPRGGVLEIATMPVDLDETAAANYEKLRPGRFVQVAVSDTGSGMDEVTLERAFEPFFTTKGRARGSGLGLSSVQAIVQRSEGDLRIYSEVGVGTTVRCLFPLAEGKVEQLETFADESPRLDGLRILLVEDDRAVRRLLRRLLKHAGARVTWFGDPLEAAGVAAQYAAQADLLITDVVMPGMNGAELAQAYLQQNPSLPVLFISGYLEGSMVERGILEPGVELLQKPFTETQLLQRVRSVVAAERERPR